MPVEKQHHVPLALKYRPMTFADVVGQEHVTRTLKHAIEMNRVANAYLFIGPRGIGKTTLSRIFAKALNCSSPHELEPCGECKNCQSITQGNSLDVVELDAASHNKVEDARDLISQVDYPPTQGKYKIFIIDECHMLSNAAWNALLKTLEEPPPYLRFIFATTEGDKVLATIVSRCQRFDLRRIQTNAIAGRLGEICKKEGISATTDALLAIARGAEGGMRDALSALDQLISFKDSSEITEADVLGIFGLVSREALENLAGAILRNDAAAILKAIETFDSSGRNMRRLASELMTHFRNLVVFQALGADTPSLEATPEQKETLAAHAKLAPAERIFRLADQLSEMEAKLKNALSVRALIEMTLLRLGRTATVASIEEIMRAVRALAANAPQPSATAPAQARTSIATASSPSHVPQQAQQQAPQPKVSRDGEGAVATHVRAATPAPTPAPAPAPAVEGNILDDPKMNNIMRAMQGKAVEITG